MDYVTHLPPAAPIPWLHISEPTGFIGGRLNQQYFNLFSDFVSAAENCSGFTHPSLRKTAYDLDCRQKHSTVCQVGPVSFTYFH